MPHSQDVQHDRFFSVKQDNSGRSISIPKSTDSDENSGSSCSIFRLIQHLLPCLKSEGVWTASRGDVLSHDANEAKYPRMLKVLENPVFDIIFLLTSVLSMFLALFAEGFLMESRPLWGILHILNAIYALGHFCRWLQILVKAKYAKVNHGYTARDIFYTVACVFPGDLIVLTLFTMHDEDDATGEVEGNENPIEYWMITASRLNYILRIRDIQYYFSKWEDHLVIGDFKMFLIRTFFYATLGIHFFACYWHRIACDSFEHEHFLMTADEATVEVCAEDSWMGLLLKKKNETALLNHPNWHVLQTHYFVSVYWAIVATFRLGACDIKPCLSSDYEVFFISLTEILAWIFVLTRVNGTLTSLFIEKDTEKENFQRRCYAIRNFLQFGEVVRSIQDDVNRFYNYLWERSSGLIHIDLVDVMPRAMKSEVFYDVNKFVLDQIPLLQGLETPFLMSLSVRTSHQFYMSGEILFRKNETAVAMYYLVKGHLEILSDNERHVITTIHSGSAIGEIHLVQPYPHIATVRCGSDCEIRTLSRKHFKQVLNIYPQYIPILEQRLETRLEQCALLLALCEKHNTYHKAFKVLKEFKESSGSVSEFMRSSSDNSNSFENVAKVLSAGKFNKKIKTNRVSEDVDGLSLSADMLRRFNRDSGDEGYTERINAINRGYEEALTAAYEALDADVARACALAKDLNIPRPPLTVTAPNATTHVTLGYMPQFASHNCFVNLFKRLKNPQKSGWVFAWKFVVTVCSLLAFWYFPYRFGFQNAAIVKLDFSAHVVDVIFALDCFYDMIQIVVTPQKTFETVKEIAIYRLKSVYFYIRIFSFLPLEYIFAPIAGIESTSPYFHLFKLNRIIQTHLVFRFLNDFEARFRIIPIIVSMTKFGMCVVFVAHIAAVFHSYVMDHQGLNWEYRHCFYWALVVTTALGYGDFPARNNLSLTAEILGLMVGVSTIVYMTAKIAAMLVNSERRRKSFKQTFYALEAFMKQRKFPKDLSSRVENYYNLQWQAHQGTLIPKGRSIMWDAPKSVYSRVCHALSYNYVARIPLFTNAPIYLQNDICMALRSYLIPPGEILLRPNELAGDLYIIARGYVEVSVGGKPVAVFTEGRYFGLNGLLFGVNPDFMFKTLTYCHIYCLHHEAFRKVMDANPSFINDVELITNSEKSTNQEELNTTPDLGTDYPSREFLDKLMKIESGAISTIGFNLSKGDSQGPSSFFRRAQSRFKNLCNQSYILPNGAFIKWWMGVRVAAAVFVTIFVAAQIAFPMDPIIGFVGTLAFDVVAWIDMAISMRCAYYGDQNQLITDSRKMASHYFLKGSFVIDLISSFPADMIPFLLYEGLHDHHEEHNMHELVSLSRLNRMLQCYKLFVTNAILEKTMFKSLSFLMLVEVVPVMFLCLNVTMCLSIVAVCGVSRHGVASRCGDSSWIIRGMARLSHDNYTHEKIDLTGTRRAYYIGLYWVTQSMLSVGYGDVEIGSDPDNQLVAVVVVLFGLLSAVYMGGKLTSCMVGEDPSKTELQEKMNLMNKFIEQQKVSSSVRRRVRETYLASWNKTKGVSPTNLFQALPPAIKIDVMRQLYGPILKSSPLFEDLDGPGLRMLASSLHEIFYPEGEFLMKFGDLCNDVFFIAHGSVVCYNVRGMIMSQMGDGSMIAEIAPAFHSHRLYTVIAVKDVNAYVFKKDDFMAFLAQYPQIKGLLETFSQRHYREALMGSKKAVELLPPDVQISVQNEKRSSIVLPYRKGIGSIDYNTTLKEPAPSKSRQSSGSGKEKFSFTTSVDGNDGDLTRNLLTESVLKSPEDLSVVESTKWWSYLITFGRKARDEMGLIHIYQDASLTNFCKFTIHPSSAICNWVSLYLFLTALSCGISAYEIAFNRTDDSQEESIGLIAIWVVLEMFFVIRIFGSFHLGYYDETATLITDVKLISRRYIYKVDGLWLDFITTFPFYLLDDIIGNTMLTDYIRGIQLLRVALFVRYLQESDSSLQMKVSRAKLIKTAVLLCFIFHFWACAWYLVACNSTGCSRGSWMHKTLIELKLVNKNENDPSSVNVASRYLLSLYYVSNALTETGFASISARTNTELCLSIIMMFGTIFVIGYLVGEMAQCLASQVATKIHYQHRLSVLENHFQSLGISNEKMAAVRDYFKLLWCRCKGETLHDLMAELPYSLRADLATEIYGPNLKYSRILGKLDENLLRQICAHIRHEIYFPGSHIVRAGDVCTSMYFIKKGEVVILDEHSNLELCVEVLYENECFGEVKLLLPKEQFRFSYRTKLETEVGVLHKEDLEAVLSNHPRMFEEVRDKAYKVKLRRQSQNETEGSILKHPGRKSRTSIKSGGRSARFTITPDKEPRRESKDRVKFK